MHTLRRLVSIAVGDLRPVVVAWGGCGGGTEPPSPLLPSHHVFVCYFVRLHRVVHCLILLPVGALPACWLFASGHVSVSVCCSSCAPESRHLCRAHASLRGLSAVGIAPRATLMRLETGQRCGPVHVDRSVLMHPAATPVGWVRARAPGVLA